MAAILPNMTAPISVTVLSVEIIQLFKVTLEYIIVLPLVVLAVIAEPF
jgi:hypothetical protein